MMRGRWAPPTEVGDGCAPAPSDHGPQFEHNDSTTSLLGAFSDENDRICLGLLLSVVGDCGGGCVATPEDRIYPAALPSSPHRPRTVRERLKSPC
eukprot:7901323-Pyramimonas_sp.AAC.1